MIKLIKIIIIGRQMCMYISFVFWFSKRNNNFIGLCKIISRIDKIS